MTPSSSRDNSYSFFRATRSAFSCSHLPLTNGDTCLGTLPCAISSGLMGGNLDGFHVICSMCWSCSLSLGYLEKRGLKRGSRTTASNGWLRRLAGSISGPSESESSELRSASMVDSVGSGLEVRVPFIPFSPSFASSSLWLVACALKQVTEQLVRIVRSKCRKV